MPDGKGFCSSFKEAEQAYKTWKRRDPFSHIPPALLSSADIADYVRLVGLIYPFHEDSLKGATYTVQLKGMCIYYEEMSSDRIEHHVFCVGKDDLELPHAKDNQVKYEIREKLVLEPNSITFLTLEPVFQVPDYLVLRFNLRIPHIYKGLLLGTGPIIDPGFQGRLSIPLHNLTSNRYVFSQGEDIISLEVTKMSPNPRWEGFNVNPRLGEYIPTDIPAHRQVNDYIGQALEKTDSSTIISSVIAATDEAKKKASNAESTANKLDDKIRTYAIGGVVALAVAVITLFVTIVYPTWQLLKSSADTQIEYACQIQALEQKITELEDLLEMLGGESRFNED